MSTKQRKPKKGWMQHWGKLEAKDRALIVVAVNAGKMLPTDIHMGMLPFISTHIVHMSLRNQKANDDKGSVFQRVLNKLDAGHGGERPTSWTITLKAMQVDKSYSRHLYERGCPIPHTMPERGTAGLKWSLHENGYVPDDDVMLKPHFIMRIKRRVNYMFTQYEVTCDQRYKARLKDFLLTNYCK